MFPLKHRFIKVTFLSEKHIKIFSNSLLTYHQIAPSCVMIAYDAASQSTHDAGGFLLLTKASPETGFYCSLFHFKYIEEISITK